MKTLATLLFAAATAVTFNANADTVHGDPGMADAFPVQEVQLQPQAVKAVADTGKQVWSVAFEEYVNPADFNLSSTPATTVASALQTMDNNPPAAGSQSQSVFKWNETAGEYQL